MSSKIKKVMLAGLMLVLSPMAANAGFINYQVEGIFEDGGILSGSFEWDSVGGPTYGTITVETSSGILLGGTTYSSFSGAGGTILSGEYALGYISFSDGAGSILWLNFVSDLWTNNTSSALALVGASYETDAAGATRNLVSGFARAVPEPCTLALLGIGFLGMGLARRRRIA